MAAILLVEDDDALCASLRLQLEDDGHRVYAERSAEAALVQLAGGGTIDLLLADVRLGGMSGVELVRQLVQERRLPPTLLISGEATISETVEALRLGVRDFLEKPFSRERLRQSLRTGSSSNVSSARSSGSRRRSTRRRPCSASRRRCVSCARASSAWRRPTRGC